MPRRCAALSTADQAGEYRTGRLFIRSQQTRKSCLLQGEPFCEAPWAATPLVLEVDPMRLRTGVPESVPEHREIVAIRGKPNDVSDADPFRISALKSVCDAQGAAFALAPAAQKALIPAAWRQLVPDEGGYAA